MADSEGIGSKIKKTFKGMPKVVKRIIIITIGVLAFILIICAAWKQQLLEITSGEINNNQIKVVAKIES